MENLFDPIILFFGLGLLAAILKSDIRLPDAIYQTISIYLLLSIGLKGGSQLHQTGRASSFYPIIITLLLGIVIPLVAFAIARFLFRFRLDDSAALSSHYGSTSAVTFALAIAFFW